MASLIHNPLHIRTVDARQEYVVTGRGESLAQNARVGLGPVAGVARHTLRSGQPLEEFQDAISEGVGVRCRPGSPVGAGVIPHG